jgi:hypothetical protein
MSTILVWEKEVAQLEYWLATGWMAEWFEFESRYGKDFSPLHAVQTGSGAHPASYPEGTVGSFSRW